MPTTYTHDLFGKAVYQKLSEGIREAVARHRMSFTIGLHGPDILFYYRPFHNNEVNQTGHRMHEEIAADFFYRCKQKYLETRDEAVLVYTLGFICHFMLDSTCHPYIYKYTEKTGAGHDEIETELDRVLMEKNGKNPFSYRPACVIHPDKEAISAIAAVLDGISQKQVKKSLRSMWFYTRVTVSRGCVRRAFLLKILKILGIYDETQGRVMRKSPSKRCEQSNRELMVMIKCAVPETVTVLEEFYETLEDVDYLNYRFSRNYKY